MTTMMVVGENSDHWRPCSEESTNRRRGRQWISAVAAGPGHAVAVDKNRLTRLEDLRNGIGLTIHVAMVGDSCVVTQVIGVRPLM